MHLYGARAFFDRVVGVQYASMKLAVAPWVAVARVVARGVGSVQFEDFLDVDTW